MLVSICISFPGHPSTCTCITFFHARTFFPYMCVSHLLHHINPSLIKVQVQWEMGCPCTALQINGSRFEPWPGHCVVFLGKTLYSHSASPYRRQYKWWGLIVVDKHPSRRSNNTPSHFMLWKPGYALAVIGHYNNMYM